MNQVQNGTAANLKGRAMLLKLHATLNFFDQSFKKVVNENLNLMTFLCNKADHLQTRIEETADDSNS